MQFSQCFSQSWQAGAHDSPQRLRHKKKGTKEREEEIVVNKGKLTDVCVYPPTPPREGSRSLPNTSLPGGPPGSSRESQRGQCTLHTLRVCNLQ